jgi:Tfp pilus assembly protein PilE
MKKFFKNLKKEKGFALIFTIMIVSVVSIVSAGIINSSYKQLILSSLAKDSQVAFYMADTASDCALYADLVEIYNGTFNITGSTWNCAGYSLRVINLGVGGYNLLSPTSAASSGEPCFDIYITKNAGNTEISARGYNTCNKSSPRVVEREIEVNY